MLQNLNIVNLIDSYSESKSYISKKNINCFIMFVVMIYKGFGY